MLEIDDGVVARGAEESDLSALYGLLIQARHLWPRLFDDGLPTPPTFEAVLFPPGTQGSVILANRGDDATAAAGWFGLIPRDDQCHNVDVELVLVPDRLDRYVAWQEYLLANVLESAPNLAHAALHQTWDERPSPESASTNRLMLDELIETGWRRTACLPGFTIREGHPYDRHYLTRVFDGCIPSR